MHPCEGLTPQATTYTLHKLKMKLWIVVLQLEAVEFTCIITIII
jgi:hypothetical protein